MTDNRNTNPLPNTDATATLMGDSCVLNVTTDENSLLVTEKSIDRAQILQIVLSSVFALCIYKISLAVYADFGFVGFIKYQIPLFLIFSGAASFIVTVALQYYYIRNKRADQRSYRYGWMATKCLGVILFFIGFTILAMKHKAMVASKK